ncbi:TetR/AcrR family transcriptional regulator [Pseudomonas sp. GD03842]|uniref:TetR/AcrR family transcriptional regulator n=1 Tax=Pseudomonas sp. GD03842 TaxID=2975385 RepID=UPI00244A230E|nr:TetR/AcrR family transcriptional regulator [Pseudomonas sp. GD03842]MDH0748881.1 TetR/AcrR family transcriptional regulator [Pseudomonas sp. GD03842]
MNTHSTTYFDILDCARSLIVAGGYSGFSYADISEFVGIRKASIHHHFPTKVDLVRTLVMQYRQQAEAGIAELERQCPDAADQLRAYIGYWMGCIDDAAKGYCVCALLATQIPVLPQEIVLEVRAHFRSLSAWLTSVLERGAMRGRLVLSNDARTEAEAFMAAVHGAMLSARAYGDPKVFGTIVEPLVGRLIASG